MSAKIQICLQAFQLNTYYYTVFKSHGSLSTNSCWSPEQMPLSQRKKKHNKILTQMCGVFFPSAVFTLDIQVNRMAFTFLVHPQCKTDSQGK